MGIRIRTGPDFMDIPEDDEPAAPCCDVCGCELERERCDDCGGDGYWGHDCGEDVCCCLDPEDNEPCETCGGEGGWWYCPRAKYHEETPHAPR